uniref:Uncharacterized protein n=1 Tax=Melopsittacus undulatus TaxID=13146 RepID=A0A8V5GF51_MELUD
MSNAACANQMLSEMTSSVSCGVTPSLCAGREGKRRGTCSTGQLILCWCFCEQKRGFVVPVLPIVPSVMCCHNPLASVHVGRPRLGNPSHANPRGRRAASIPSDLK